MPASHPLFAAAEARAVNGRLTQEGFWSLLHDTAISLIDTPEERKGFGQAAVAVFDKFVGPHLPPALAAFIRMGIEPACTAGLAYLATL